METATKALGLSTAPESRQMPIKQAATAIATCFDLIMIIIPLMRCVRRAACPRRLDVAVGRFPSGLPSDHDDLAGSVVGVSFVVAEHVGDLEARSLKEQL